MKENSVLLICALMLFFMSCQRKERGIKNLAAYVEDLRNGLTKITKTNGWEYKAQYRPAELIIVGEGEGPNGMAEGDKSKRKQQLRGTVWFTLSIQREKEQISPLRFQVLDEAMYNERLDYFLHEAAGNFHLLYGRDTLYPISYHFETTYNLSPKEIMIIGFVLPNNLEVPIADMQLVYTDRIFRNGIIKAYFHQKDLHNIHQFAL